MRTAEEDLTSSSAASLRTADWPATSVSPTTTRARPAGQARPSPPTPPDAPLSDGADPGMLADLLGEDDPAVAHVIDMDAIHAHLDELPEREQRILMLRFFGNLTRDQIGHRLGMSQMHVSRLLDHALTYLRAQITDPAEDVRDDRHGQPTR